jgi:hypothetical protein
VTGSLREKTITGDQRTKIKRGWEVNISSTSHWIVKVWYVAGDNKTHILLEADVSGGGTLYIYPKICTRHDPFMIVDGVKCYRVDADLFKDMREFFDHLKQFRIGSAIDVIVFSTEGSVGTETDKNIEWNEIEQQVRAKLFPVPQNNQDLGVWLDMLEKCRSYNRGFISNYWDVFKNDVMPDFDTALLGQPSVAPYDSGHEYRLGDWCYYQGNFYRSEKWDTEASPGDEDLNVGNTPGQSPWYWSYQVMLPGAGIGGTTCTVGRMDNDGIITLEDISGIDLSISIFGGRINNGNPWGYRITSMNAGQWMCFGAIKIPALTETQKGVIKEIALDAYIFRPFHVEWAPVER